MPPDKVRRPVVSEAAEDEAPDDGLSAATLPPTTTTAQARLIAKIEEALGGPPRCLNCHRQLHVFRSIVLGRGPVCAAKAVKRS
jgi:hypothetical protein